MAPRTTEHAESPERRSPRKRRRLRSADTTTAEEQTHDCSASSDARTASDDEWTPDVSSDEDGISDEDNEDSVSESTLRDVALPRLQAQLATGGHTPEFYCTVCEREFSFKHALVRHLKCRHRSDARPFECQLCLLAFRTVKELDAHTNDHKGVRNSTSSGANL